MAYRLSGLTLNRVDLVPDGSNPDAHIVLFKAKKEASVAKKVTRKKVVKKTPKADTRTKARQNGDDEDEEEEEDEAVITKGEEDDEEEEEEDDEESDDSEDDEEEEEAPSRTKKTKKTKPAKKVKKVSAKADDGDEDDEDIADEEDDEIDEDDEESAEVEKVAKSLPKAAQALFLKMRDDLSAVKKQTRRAEKIAQIEKSKREKLEFVEKAKKTIPSLPGTFEEKGEMIQSLYNGEPVEKKMADAIVKLLKSGDAAVRSMMTSTGRTSASSEETSAFDELTEKRDAIMKADPKLTKEAAMERAMRENPAIYRAYRVEKGRRRVGTDDVQ